jgi:hypothetical protein
MKLLWGAAAAIAVLGGAADQQVAAPRPALLSDEVTADAIAELVAAFQAELGRLPANASSEDVEAVLALTIDQRRAPCPLWRAAFVRLRGKPVIQPKLPQAMRAVAWALRLCGGGTAALANRGGGAVTGVGLTAPVVNVTGGTSNYSR